MGDLILGAASGLHRGPITTDPTLNEPNQEKTNQKDGSSLETEAKLTKQQTHNSKNVLETALCTFTSVTSVKSNGNLIGISFFKYVLEKEIEKNNRIHFN